MRNCVLCRRELRADETQHYPCFWGCDEPLRTLRREQPDAPTCIGCLPSWAKTGVGSWRPILSAADLPKIGERLPLNVVLHEHASPHERPLTAICGMVGGRWVGPGGPEFIFERPITRPLRIESVQDCDWGCCDVPAVCERLHPNTGWLPVCATCKYLPL